MAATDDDPLASWHDRIRRQRWDFRNGPVV
jgi:hypothetical protein